MKKIKVWKELAAALALAGVCGLTACGSSSESITTSTGYMASSDSASISSRMSYELEYEESESSTDTSVEMSDYYDSRKLIRTVDLSVETQEFDSMLAKIEVQVNALGGYIESQDTYNGSSYYDYGYSSRTAYITARIPADSLDEFLNQVSEGGQYHQSIRER